MDKKDIELTESDLQDFLNAPSEQQMQILLAHAERNQELIQRKTEQTNNAVEHKEDK